MSAQDRFQRVDALFRTACTLPPAEREAFLKEQVAGETTILMQVRAMLAADQREEGVLDRAALVRADTVLEHDPEPVAISECVGPYRIVRKIGEGGFGVVYMAEQESPVKRRVALKVIKHGMDTRQSIARFERERQALAMMEHPNIARVLDAGTTESGRLFFVMELVRGIPLTEYCDQNSLSPRERLDLFVPVCHAIQHAHQKGIIHRDIKPSNVLVAMQDGKPVPKVIDFGIAKVTHQRLTDKTLMTELRALIGTPAYMSPEQADLTGLDIDTRSDVYSLGVLLYELLTGTTPFETTTLLEAGMAGMQRILREVDPPRPSTRLGMLGDTIKDVAGRRRTDAQRLRKFIRGDLDWIIMKALEKDRTRRYDSATGLADDVQRYLSDEPVKAGPPSASYRLRKLVRRNRGAFIAIGAVAAALVIGLSLATAGFISADRQRAQAVAARSGEAEQRRAAEAALAQTQRAEAEARRAEADAKRQAERAQMTSGFLTEVLAAPSPYSQGRDLSIAGLMEFASNLASQRFSGEPREEALIRHTIAQSFHHQGNPTRAEQESHRAIQTLETAGDPDRNLRWELMLQRSALFVQMGRSNDAVALDEQVLREVRAAGGDFAEMEERAMLDLGWACGGERRLELVQDVINRRTARLGPKHPRVLELEGAMAAGLVAAGRATEALPFYRRDLERILREHGETSVVTVGARDALGWCLLRAGQANEAAPVLQVAVEHARRTFGETHAKTLTVLDNYTRCLLLLKRWEELAAVAGPVLERYRANNVASGRIETMAAHLATARLALGDKAGARDPCLTFLRATSQEALPPDSGPRTWNEYAWRLVGVPCCDVLEETELRELALRAEPFALRAVEQGAGDERHWMFTDTLAMVKFRLGEFDEAVRLQKEAIAGMRAWRESSGGAGGVPANAAEELDARLARFERAAREDSNSAGPR